jgi:hypothetical protein
MYTESRLKLLFFARQNPVVEQSEMTQDSCLIAQPKDFRAAKN